MLKMIMLSSFLLSVSTSIAGTISIVGPPSSVNIGDTFTVDVGVTGGTDLYAFQFDLTFNPTLLSAVSVLEGAFLPSGGTTFFVPGAIDNLGGTVAATADTLIGAVPGVTGGGTLAEFQFAALAGGTSALSFANEILLDSSLNDITSNTTFQDGSLTINGAAAVPEPTTLALLLCATLLAIAVRRGAHLRT
jgi:general secretion pathway protein D